MCGINGVFNHQLYHDVEIKVKSMNDLTLHRGPDFSSYFSYKNIYLGHTRLSILDTSSLGNQPMFSEQKDFVIVYNGEIYNHNEIREYLIKKYNCNFISIISIKQQAGLQEKHTSKLA